MRGVYISFCPCAGYNMNIMRFALRIGIGLSCLVLLGASFGVEGAGAQQTEQFYVQKEYDAKNRSDLAARELLAGERARFYVEEEYWNDISSSKRERLQEELQELSSLFDVQIYPRVSAVFGEPWMPGIDGDPKITLLFSQMEDGVGGAFRFDDQRPRVEQSRSNEREMLYLNVLYADHYVIREFLAHELVHLIQYNQKTRPWGAREEVWLSELLAEQGPAIAGLHQGRYEDTNFQNRVEMFQKNPGDSLTEWGKGAPDYASVALFGHYIRTRYGADVLGHTLRSPVSGIAALEDGFVKAGTGTSARQAFMDWLVASALNDCSVGGSGTYCYDDPNLPFSQLHIRFQHSGQSVDRGASFEAMLRPWSGQWLRAEYDKGKQEGVLVYEVSTSPARTFSMPYVVFNSNGNVSVHQLEASGGATTLAVDGFGRTVEAVLLIPVNMLNRDIAVRSNLSVVDEVPAGVQVPPTVELTDVQGVPLIDGDLIRQEGSIDVYIVKLVGEKAFKRLILNPDIFNSYGHLSWERIRSVSPQVLHSLADSQFVIEVYPDGRPVSGQVFQLMGSAGADTGTKRRVSGGYDPNGVYHINHLEAANTFYPLVP